MLNRECWHSALPLVHENADTNVKIPFSIKGEFANLWDANRKKKQKSIGAKFKKIVSSIIQGFSFVKTTVKIDTYGVPRVKKIK